MRGYREPAAGRYVLKQGFYPFIDIVFLEILYIERAGSHMSPTVAEQIKPGAASGFIRGKEKTRISDVVGDAELMQRVTRLAQLMKFLAEQPDRFLSGGGVRGYGVAAHPVQPQFVGNRIGEGQNCTL